MKRQSELNKTTISLTSKDDAERPSKMLKKSVRSNLDTEMKAEVSPYDIMPPEYRRRLGRLDAKKDAMRKQPRKEQMTTDELLSLYAQEKVSRSHEIEKVVHLSSTLPYMTNIAKIDHSIKIVDHLSSIAMPRLAADSESDILQMPSNSHGTNREGQQSQHSLVTIDHIRKRFPRLCAPFRFTEKSMVLMPYRSEVWMVRFMEECYDTAFSSCCRSNTAHYRTNCGLDLGEMDAFPLVVQRILSRKFSVMTVRDRMCLEMLATLEYIIDSGDAASPVYAQPDPSKTAYLYEDTIDPQRALIFAKFLSEEYDSSYLAMFLHARDVVEKALTIRFVEVNQPKIWVPIENEIIDNPDGVVGGESAKHSEKAGGAVAIGAGARSNKERNYPLGRSSSSPHILAPIEQPPIAAQKDVYAALSGVDRDKQIKVVPTKLPPSLTFLNDFTMTEAPIVGFDASLLPNICNSMVAKAGLKQRLYLADKIAAMAKSFFHKGKQWQRISRVNREQSVASMSPQQKQRILGAYDNLQKTSTVNENTKETVHVQSDALSVSKLSVLSGESQNAGTLTNFIPVTAVLLTLIEEWKRVPESAKTFLDEVIQTQLSLRELNAIYQRDCELSRNLVEEIKATEATLSACTARLMRNEKAQKRLERKWEDRTTEEEDLDELVEMRLAVTQLAAEKGNIESNLKLLKERKASLDQNIESLWQQVHPESSVDANKKKKKKKAKGLTSKAAKVAEEADEAAAAAAVLYETDKANVKWRDDIVVRLEIAVKYNEKMKREHDKLFSTDKTLEETTDDTEMKSAAVEELVPEPTPQPQAEAPAEEPIEDLEDDATRALKWAKKEEERRAREIDENARLLQEMLEHGADAYLERQRKRKEEEERKRLALEEEQKRKGVYRFASSLVEDIIDDAVDSISEAMAWKQRDFKEVVDVMAHSAIDSIEKSAVDHVAADILQHHEALAAEATQRAEDLLVDETIADLEYMGTLEAIIMERQRLAKLAEEEANRIAEERAIAEAMAAADRTVRRIVTQTLQDIIETVVERLTDPWLPLDEEPESWLSASVLAVVAGYNERAGERWRRALLRLGFTLISRDWNIRRMCVRREQRMKRYVLEAFVDAKLDMLQQRNDSAVVIQKSVDRYLGRKARRDYAKHLVQCDIMAEKFREECVRSKAVMLLKFWRKRILVKWRGDYLQEHRNNQRLTKAYKLWKERRRRQVEEKNRDAALKAAAVRVIQFRAVLALSRIRLRKRVKARVINRFARSYLARKRVYAMRVEMKRLHEKSVALTVTALFRKMQKSWAKWHRLHEFYVGFTKWDRALSSIFYKDAFVLWKMKAQARKNLELRSAIKIQSTFRMWFSMKYVFAYYRWRRALCKFQALYRAIGPRQQFQYDFPYYRAAKSIQRIYRGYLIRNDFAGKRVRDIHYASRTNNYDRLLYYVNNYPELINEYDDEGNSALHNAAKTASKRTLKLLAKSNLDMNALNFAGYSPLHLTIMSTAINRDDVCMYMIERGFDETQKTADGKTSLLLACEHGRTVIAKNLLEYGIDPNTPDDSGNTCLQFACAQGLYPLVDDLIEHGADVNAPCYYGTTPLHECLASGDIDIVNLLLSHGALVNVKEPYQYQTPLMWACRAGLTAIVKLYILQGADIRARDVQGRTCAHHAAYSDSEDIYNALREAEVNQEDIDNDGNTPLHVACDIGSSNFAKHLLQGGANPSVQNLEGDQPAHFAARTNNVDILRSLSLYDEHIGRINFNHQTPLGAAKFACALQAEAFLEEQYRKIEVADGRNKEGDIWWEKDFAEVVDDWSTVRYRNGKRVYVNSVTGEVTEEPPALHVDAVVEGAKNNAVTLKKKMLIVPEENETNTHAYLQEVRAFNADVSEMKRVYRAAVIMQCMARRFLSKKIYRRRKIIRTKGKKILHFIMRHKTRFFEWKRERDRQCAVMIQSAWRGHALRRQIYQTDMYDKMVYHKNCYRLYCLLYRVWKGYLTYKTAAIVEHEMHAPSNERDWNKIIARCGYPVRVVGAVEEYLAPGPGRIYIYRHTVTRICTFIKPKKLRLLDERDRRDGIEIAKYGHSKRQVRLATRLQALWRGHMTRTHAKYIEKALVASLSIEREYFIDPDKDSNLYNFAMHCHIVLQDYERARGLYNEAMRRMVWRGPDVAFVLYSYAIFNFVTHDLDYTDICLLLARARRAEETREELIRRKRGELEIHARIMANGTFRYGKVFDQARIGFFQHYAKTKNDAPSWHSYAAVQFLIYFDFNSSFDAFLAAFQHDKTDRKLRANFDIMMQHFHGTDKYYLAKIIDERMQIVAKKDKEAYASVLERRELAYQRQQAVKKLQRWYRRCLWDRQSIKMRETAVQIRERKIASRQKKLNALARAQGGFPST